VLFDRVDDAVQAAGSMRGRVLGSAAWKLKVDFADRSQMRSHSPGPGRHFARFGKGGPARSGSGDVAACGPPSRVEGSERAAEAEGVRAQHQEHPDHSAGGHEGPGISESQTNQEHGSQCSAHPAEAHAASAGLDSSVGSKRSRDSESEHVHGSHPEKKSLSIIIETSSCDPSVRTNGHLNFDCLSARPAAPSEPDMCPAPVAQTDRCGGRDDDVERDVERGQDRNVDPAHAKAVGECVDEGAAADPLDRFPELWRGQAVVKGASAGVVLRCVKCEHRLVREMLVGERVTMTQRMRLGEDQMKEFGNRLESLASSVGVLLALPASAEDAPRLRQHFVTYLVERNAAGVARVESGTLYLFPPGSELASEYQKSSAIDLSLHPDYLLVILLPDPSR
jgi:hypothetical protein